MSFISQQTPNNDASVDKTSSKPTLRPSLRTLSQEQVNSQNNTNGNRKGYIMPSRSNSFGPDGARLSPPLPMGARSPSETANSSFPLNDLDYESDPAAVAQELSNLQALRRMSMDVNGAAGNDPDLPSFQSNFGIPPVAPKSESEDDASRLFWVPAHLHPELAPTEFKTFLDNRVETMKRRSGDFALPAAGTQRKPSGGGLQRKKSMLSRQIDNSGGRGADGYQDGADRLDRKRSQSKDSTNMGIANLQDLETLLNDPSKAIQRLSLESSRSGDTPGAEDLPILPNIPPTNSLRRSTRTTYRRGSLRKTDRVPPSKRVIKSPDTDTEEQRSPTPTSTPVELLPTGRTSDEQVQSTTDVGAGKNFSRPGRVGAGRGAPTISPPLPNSHTHQVPPVPATGQAASESTAPLLSTPQPKQFVSRIASNGKTTAQIPHNRTPSVPQIIKTPPQPEEQRPVSTISSVTTPKPQAPPPTSRLPERASSHDVPPRSASPPRAMPNGSFAARQAKRTAMGPPLKGQDNNQTLSQMAAHPSPLPGTGTRTDSLSFIPTLTEDKKADAKKVGLKKEPADAPRKSSWGLGFLSGGEEKEKEKRKEEEAKGRVKAKTLTKPGDNTRLDVLQTTMEGSRGRESILIDRSDIKLEEERKKESTRKSNAAEAKKEKEPGFLSSIFGGGKKKGDRESIGKKASRDLSPDPPARILKPDIDYNWTRFSILEERAIYRMAHIKLANPRRALYSQVLLSNFMYSYLAKVQQMHPQIQIPQTAAQKAQQRLQEERARKKSDQPEEYYQYQKYQEVGLLHPYSLRYITYLFLPIIASSTLEDNKLNLLTQMQQQQDAAHSNHTQAATHHSSAHGPSAHINSTDGAYDHDASSHHEHHYEYGDQQDPMAQHRTSSRAGPGQHQQHAGSNGIYGPGHGGNSTAYGPGHGSNNVANGPGHGSNNVAHGPGHGGSTNAHGPGHGGGGSNHGPGHGGRSNSSYEYHRGAQQAGNQQGLGMGMNKGRAAREEKEYSAYQYQNAQFEEPGRDMDDDMW